MVGMNVARIKIKESKERKMLRLARIAGLLIMLLLGYVIGKAQSNKAEYISGMEYGLDLAELDNSTEVK